MTKIIILNGKKTSHKINVINLNIKDTIEIAKIIWNIVDNIKYTPQQ